MSERAAAKKPANKAAGSGNKATRLLLGLPKRAWQWLTKMKTALVLLFLLAIAAIPGALLPQRSLNKDKVADYIAANGTTAEVFDKLGLFDVFSSTWFMAIYVLLFISLVGCILPRTWDHYKALRSTPPKAPKILKRMPNYVTGEVDTDPEAMKELLRHEFKGWHVAETKAEDDRAGRWSVSAERGYLREFANLVFHLALVGILVSVGVGRMTYYEGQAIVVADTENSEFCNTAVSNFDSFRHGQLFDGTGLHPYCINVKDFNAEYLPNGQALDFESNIDYAAGDAAYEPHEKWEKTTLKVNHPLRIEGDRIYLQGHGYAPTFTIKWPNGEKVTETTQFRPDDQINFLSSGAMRWDPPADMFDDELERRNNQIAIQGLFAPTAEFTGEKGALLTSRYPAMTDPAVAIDVYRGQTGLDAGTAQSIFSLNPEQMHSGLLEKLDRVNLKVGEKVTLDDGTEITFDGAKEFINIQIGHDPTLGWVFFFAVLMLASLVLSLSIKRRRLWIRLAPRTDGQPGTELEIAGLARTDSAGWGAEFNRTAERILGLEEEDLDEEHSAGSGSWEEDFGDGLDEQLRDR